MNREVHRSNPAVKKLIATIALKKKFHDHMTFPALFNRIQIKMESIGLEVMKMLSISENSEFFSHFPAKLTEEVFLIRSQFLFNLTVQLLQ